MTDAADDADGRDATDDFSVHTRGTTRLTADQRKAVQTAYLTEPGVGKAALARRFKIDKATVTRCLAGEDFKEVRQAVLEERKQEARHLLAEHANEAVESWRRTFSKAVKRGDHRPMADWARAAGVSEDKDKPPIVVQVGIKLTGRRE